MNKDRKRKNAEYKEEKHAFEQSSLKELIEQSKRVRDSISETLTYLSVIKQDHEFAS